MSEVLPDMSEALSKPLAKARPGAVQMRCRRMSPASSVESGDNGDGTCSVRRGAGCPHAWKGG